MKGLLRIARQVSKAKSGASRTGRYTVGSSSGRGRGRQSKLGRMTTKPKVSRASNRPSRKRLPGRW